VVYDGYLVSIDSRLDLSGSPTPSRKTDGAGTKPSIAPNSRLPPPRSTGYSPLNRLPRLESSFFFE
ncbi:MAG: hypothetical protein AB7J13_16280, partial [Pyrinomonadaceae bacterium]